MTNIPDKRVGSVCLTALWVLLSILPQSSPAQSNIAKIDELLTMLHNQDQLNGFILIAEKGKATFKKGYGYANEETKQGFDENTIFELASVSKQFTAMGIVILKEKGKLSYDDKITKFIPKLEDYKDISVRNLLNHTSGIPDYINPKYFELFDKSKINTNKDLIDILAKEKVRPLFEPGSKFRYSNTGYVLLASIIESVSKQSYASFLEKCIFKPLKMKRTFVYSRRLSPRKLDNYAMGYTWNVKEQKKVIPDTEEWLKFVIYLDGILGDGNISSSAADLLKWEQAFNTEKLVSKESINEIFTPVVLNDKTNSEYGFGWFVNDSKEYGKIVSHTGSFPGYKTSIERYLASAKTVILLQNYDRTVLPRKNIREAIYNQPLTKVFRKQIAISPDLIDKYVGDYKDKSDEKSIISITKGGNWLVYNSTENKGWNLPLFPESETLFFSKALPLYIEFVESDKKEMAIKLYQDGKLVGEAVKIK